MDREQAEVTVALIRERAEHESQRIREPDEREIAQLFTAWATEEGILARVTKEQCADLALAFAAGMMAQRVLIEYTPQRLLRDTIEKMQRGEQAGEG